MNVHPLPLSVSYMETWLCVEIWDHTLHANADLDREPTPAEIAAVTRMSIAELRQSLAAITALHQVTSPKSTCHVHPSMGASEPWHPPYWMPGQHCVSTTLM